MSGILTPFPYQVRALEAVSSSWRQAGKNRVLVKMPTGTGKTVMFAEMLKHLGDAITPGKGARMLVIAHREEILDQALEKIQRQNPGLMVSIEQGDRRSNRYSDVIVASIQSLQARDFERLRNLLRHHDPKLVIVDEAHHSAAATYRTALCYLGFLPFAEKETPFDKSTAKDWEDVFVMERELAQWDRTAGKDRLLVGVTATPIRSDAIGLGCVYQDIVYDYALRKAIDDGYLVPIVPYVVETDTDLDVVKTSHGDFNQRQLGEAVNTSKRNELAVAARRDYAAGLATIAFTVDVAHAHSLAEAFQNDNVPAMAISGETPRDDRRIILRQYREGRIEVVTNCMVLTEGTDLPLTRCILHAKPTKSSTLYEQMTGRGLRLYPHKEECIVIDVVDVARKHSLLTAAVLYGLPPGILAKQGEDLRQTADEIEALLAGAPGFDLEDALEAAHTLTLEELRAKVTRFDPWSLQPLERALQSAVGMPWIKAGVDVYVLSYPWQDGDESLKVSRDFLGHFEVTATIRPRKKPGEQQQPARQRTLVHGLGDAKEALQFAEAFIQQERRQVIAMKASTAGWRSRPASAKQVALLNARRIPFPSGITAGAASDLIDLVRAREGR